MAIIPNPEHSTFSKTPTGTSDTSISDGVYKFLGCSINSINMSIAWNNSPGSLQVNLVEDTVNGDSFINIEPPLLVSFSLPRGGVGAPILYPGGKSLQPNGYHPTNVPFFFCGIVKSWKEDLVNAGGKNISVQVSDPKEILDGVKILLGEWALNQNFVASTPRFSDVKNIIDAYGYYEHGLEADKTEYGMTWDDIRVAIEDAKVTLFDIEFEFQFTGKAFDDAPSWYRVPDSTIGLVSLASKVAKDGGSDLIIVTRKINTGTVGTGQAVVEFRAVRRDNDDILYKSELQDFINARSSIVTNASLGREFKNESTSKVIVGGKRNSVYVARPTEYVETFVPGSDKRYYSEFPNSVSDRMFGDNPSLPSFNAGAIYPFWGFGSGYVHPMAEPFLSLDHIAFSNRNISQRIPAIKLKTELKTVREVSQDDMFLTDDGTSDSRPWTVIDDVQDYDTHGGTIPAGYMAGLPLNTEILRGALISQPAFEMSFANYYPTIAKDLGMHGFNGSGLWQALLHYPKSLTTADNPDKIPILGFLYNKANLVDHDLSGYDRSELSGQIYEWVREYASENMGRKFITCLPRSIIMERIWSGLSVPTNTGTPEIEYSVVDAGFWENIPTEFDGVNPGGGSSSAEQQVIDRFMGDDGRFAGMVAIDWKPSGNASFFANESNELMFQDVPTSEFAPNSIAQENPEYIFMSASIDQLAKRPDLALVTIPSQVSFDPLDAYASTSGTDASKSERWKLKFGPTFAYVSSMLEMSEYGDGIQRLIEARSTLTGQTAITRCMLAWTGQIMRHASQGWQLQFLDDRCMDLKRVLVPLTSNWVTYGPWYYEEGDFTYDHGMVDLLIDESLVPWKFDRPVPPTGWDTNLNAAAEELLANNKSELEYVDVGHVTVAGFPEIAIGSGIGYNSNLTGISTNFAIGGVTTSYDFATYEELPGTFRKKDHDDISRVTIEAKPDIPDTLNVNLTHTYYRGGTNRFWS